MTDPSRLHEADKASLDPILDTLIKADTLLTDEGRWCQRHYVSGGAMCLYGALALGDEDLAGALHDNCLHQGDSPAQIAAQIMENLVGDLSIWNDSPKTTFSDVKALLARAIQKRRDKLERGE